MNLPDSIPDAEPEAVERMLSLLQAAPIEQFGPLATIARTLLGTSMAAIRFAEGQMIWTKAASGAYFPPTPRETQLCNLVIGTDATIAVADARDDARFAHMPAVMADELRFYAGVPLHAVDPSDGERHTIGVICVGDPEPRILPEPELAALKALAELTETVIASHVTTQRAIDIATLAASHTAEMRRQERLFSHAERLALIGSWRLSLADNDVVWSPGANRIHELPEGTTLALEQALDFYPPHARDVVTGALANAIATGDPFDFEVDFVTAAGRMRRVRARGELERDGSHDVALAGVFQDVTDRYHLEQQLRRSAETDTLTGIANRAAFDAALDKAIGRTQSDDAPCILVLIDLDHFKHTNDTHGHLAGDDVLRAVGERLRAPQLQGAFAARLGGDEFAILLTDRMLVDQVDLLVARLSADLARPVVTQDGAMPCSATIGYAAFAPGIANARELIHAADNALYQAKRRRRGSAVRHVIGTGDRQRA